MSGGAAAKLAKYHPRCRLEPHTGLAANQTRRVQRALWHAVAGALAAEALLGCLATDGMCARLGGDLSRELAASVNVALGPGMRAALALQQAAALHLPAGARQRAADGLLRAVAVLLSAAAAAARLCRQEPQLASALLAYAPAFWRSAGQLLGGLEEAGVPGGRAVAGGNMHGACLLSSPKLEAGIPAPTCHRRPAHAHRLRQPQRRAVAGPELSFRCHRRPA